MPRETKAEKEAREAQEAEAEKRRQRREARKAKEKGSPQKSSASRSGESEPAPAARKRDDDEDLPARRKRHEEPARARRQEPEDNEDNEDGGSGRLADRLGGGPSFEGDKVKLADIEDEDVILVDFKFGPSRFKEGLFSMMQLEVDGEMCHTSSGSSVILDLLKRIEMLDGGKEKNLPAEVSFVRRTSEKTGRTYWTME